MILSDRIVIDPRIQHGKPVIQGTRVPMARIVGGMAGGMTSEQVQGAYGVTAEYVQAALEFATELIERGEFHPLPQ